MSHGIAQAVIFSTPAAADGVAGEDWVDVLV